MEELFPEEKADLEPKNVEPFTDAIQMGDVDEDKGILNENEKGASIKNPNSNDDRRVFQNRIHHVPQDTSIPREDQPDLLEAHGPLELDRPGHWYVLEGSWYI